VITLEDIALMAGVSHSTVSRALANSPLVNPETKARIQSLAREAGYQVNQVARNLKVRSTRTIGLVVPEVVNPYYPKVVQHVADRAREAGYSLQLHLSGADQESEASCLARLQEHRADGILLVTAERGLVARGSVDRLVQAGTPIVLMGWVDEAAHLDMVTGDDAAGGYALGRHLLDLGHRRIAVIGKPPHRGMFDRVVGFTKALAEANVVPVEFWAVNEAEVATAVRQVIRASGRPTAIFATQDSIAAMVYKHLAASGVSIPGDTTVVGFDDLDLASFLTPQLTTVGTHIEPLAMALVQVLIDRIQSAEPQSLPKQIIVTPQVVVRESCAPPRSSK
jgi:DNA-binding LacI/PurR family transcriptional regulator